MGNISHSSSSPQNFSRIQYAIRLIALILFLGFMFIWIIRPTNTYHLKWRPLIKSHTSSAYLGPSLGAYFIIFCFTVLLIAVLGCVYAHIVKKASNINIQSNGTECKNNTIWKRPILVRGPLGIISTIELTFIIMFAVLLVWLIYCYVKSGFYLIDYQSAAKSGYQVWQAKLESVGLAIGLVGEIFVAFLFFPVTRGSSVLPLLGLTSESCIKYHIWMGHITMIIFTVHSVIYVIYWALTHQIYQLLKWDNVGISNLAGVISFLGGLAMWVVTVPCIRRKTFELFFYTHYLYIVFMVFYVFHVGMVNTSNVFTAFYLFLLDRYLRFLQSRRHVRLLSARLLPCDTLELNFSKAHGLTYSPTSIMFINVPSISHLQWHPFTITSSSNLEAEKLSVVIKSC